MKRIGLIAAAFVAGLFAAWLVLALFVTVPPGCGEPAACGDDYLVPQLYIALALWAAFTASGIFLGGRVK